MPYTGSPSTNPIDRLRLNVGDIWADTEWLHDEDYQYFLDKNNGNENRATLDAARSLLFVLTRFTRERTGDIEVYGAEIFNNYFKALQLILKNPDIAISAAIPYAGGISKLDMLDNVLNIDNNAVLSPISRYKIGCGSWRYNYDIICGF